MREKSVCLYLGRRLEVKSIISGTKQRLSYSHFPDQSMHAWLTQPHQWGSANADWTRSWGSETLPAWRANSIRVKCPGGGSVGPAVGRKVLGVLSRDFSIVS